MNDQCDVLRFKFYLKLLGHDHWQTDEVLTTRQRHLVCRVWCSKGFVANDVHFVLHCPKLASKYSIWRMLCELLISLKYAKHHVEPYQNLHQRCPTTYYKIFPNKLVHSRGITTRLLFHKSHNVLFCLLTLFFLSWFSLTFVSQIQQSAYRSFHCSILVVFVADLSLILT